MKRFGFLELALALLVITGSQGWAGQAVDSPVAGAIVATPEPYDSAPEYVPGEILVRLATGVDSEQTAGVGIDHSLSTLECIKSANLCRMRIEDGSAVWEVQQRLGKDARIRYAEPNYLERPSRAPRDPDYAEQWNYGLINMPQAWGKSVGDSSIVVAVVDTGVRFDHPDLAARLSIYGYDFVDNDGDPTDPEVGHGTHVAGTIAAATNNGTGVAGMTWRGRILPVRTMGKNGGDAFQFAKGLRYAAGLLKSPDPVNPTPAQVINYSAGGPHSQTKEDAVAAVNAAGVILVCAAGNTGGKIEYPAAYSRRYPLVICVGATNYGNGNPTRAPYSSKGKAMNVVAPGGDTSEDSDGDGHPDGVLSTTWDYGRNRPSYSFWQGTSMATPHVTGLAALMLARGCPARKVRTILQDTATDLGRPGFDNLYGYGLINAAEALDQVGKH
jgi:serine protease